MGFKSESDRSRGEDNQPCSHRLRQRGESRLIDPETCSRNIHLSDYWQSTGDGPFLTAHLRPTLSVKVWRKRKPLKHLSINVIKIIKSSCIQEATTLIDEFSLSLYFLRIKQGATKRKSLCTAASSTWLQTPRPLGASVSRPQEHEVNEIESIIGEI